MSSGSIREANFSARCLFILCFADAVHLGPAFWADTLGCRFAILHFDGLGIFHFLLGLTFHAVTASKRFDYDIQWLYQL